MQMYQRHNDAASPPRPSRRPRGPAITGLEQGSSRSRPQAVELASPASDKGTASSRRSPTASAAHRPLQQVRTPLRGFARLSTPQCVIGCGHRTPRRRLGRQTGNAAAASAIQLEGRTPCLGFALKPVSAQRNRVRRGSRRRGPPLPQATILALARALRSGLGAYSFAGIQHHARLFSSHG